MSHNAPPDKIETSVTFVVKEYLCNYCGKVAKLYTGFDIDSYHDHHHFYCDCEDAKEEQKIRHIQETSIIKRGKYQTDFEFYHSIISKINNQYRTVDEFIKLHNTMTGKNYHHG